MPKRLEKLDFKRKLDEDKIKRIAFESVVGFFLFSNLAFSIFGLAMFVRGEFH